LVLRNLIFANNLQYVQNYDSSIILLPFVWHCNCFKKNVFCEILLTKRACQKKWLAKWRFLS
jgi:hypothetical protein